MCTSWTDQQWRENSQPVDPTSRYKLVDTRYSQAGVAVHTYVSTGGYWYAVLPGYGNHPQFSPNETGHTEALAFLAANGYDLTEKTTPIAEVISGIPDESLAFADHSGSRDLVENFS